MLLGQAARPSGLQVKRLRWQRINAGQAVAYVC